MSVGMAKLTAVSRLGAVRIQTGALVTASLAGGVGEIVGAGVAVTVGSAVAVAVIVGGGSVGVKLGSGVWVGRRTAVSVGIGSGVNVGRGTAVSVGDSNANGYKAIVNCR